MSPLKKLTFAVAGSLACSVATAAEPSAQLSNDEIEAANVMLASPVVVTATRMEQNSFDLPVSIDVVDAGKIQEGQLQVNISESLVRIPGMVAQSRGQFAQDIQISSRGFGARSAFGVRGVRLYADGIPLTMPDGQGQAGTFDLGSAKRIEAMRGPFSALYGNSSGGVVQIFTADGAKNPTVDGSLTVGSYGTSREAVKVSGQTGDFNYIANYSHLETEGYRDQSGARRDLFNAKLGITLNEATRLTVIATDLDQPIAKDPLGLNASQLKLNPRQAGTDAIKFNTRVEDRYHTQIGATLEHDFDADNQLRLMGYGGVRGNVQFQAIATNLQTSIKHPGGVAKIDRDFGGTDLRFTHKGVLAGGDYNFTVGTNFDTMTDDRKGYQNFVGSGSTATLGVIGALRRNENDTAWNFDQYAQAEWSPHNRWNLVAGIRHSDVHIKSEDQFIATLNHITNGDDSGKASYGKTTPVAGVVFKLMPEVNLYANAGKGFETPSLVELAYRPDGKPGLNFDLRPATSNNYEVGAKAFLGANTRANIAVFKTDTNNEIVTATNASGRSSYQNAGGTDRKGVELSLDSDIGNGFTAYASYAFLDATYSDSFKSCVGVTPPCSLASRKTVAAGNYIPGTYRQTAYAEAAWKHTPSGFSTAIETRINSKAYVDDLNRETAAGFAIMNWRGGFSQTLSNWHLSEFVRVENLFNRNYVGSVKVNDGNSRYYEPGSNRNWLLGFNAGYHF